MHQLFILCELTAATAGRHQSRSAVSGALMVAWTRTSTGQCSFAVYGPRTWNWLPPALLLPELSLSSFKRQFKTHLFQHWCAGCSCVSYVLPSGAVATDVSSAPIINVPTQHNSEWVCDMLCRRSPLPWSCRHWSVGCICSWLSLDDPSTPVVLSLKLPTRWFHQRSKGSWSFALQFVVHHEIHQESPPSPSQLGCWTSTEKGHNLVGLLS